MSVEITAKNAKDAKDSMAIVFCTTLCYPDTVGSRNTGELNHEEHKEHEERRQLSRQSIPLRSSWPLW